MDVLRLYFLAHAVTDSIVALCSHYDPWFARDHSISFASLPIPNMRLSLRMLVVFFLYPKNTGVPLCDIYDAEYIF